MLNHKIIVFLIAGISLVSCKKTWMEGKSNKSLDVPTSIKDFQAMLDHGSYMNDSRPSLGEISADNYYVSATMWQGYNTDTRSRYTWSKEIYNDVLTDNLNWNFPYRQVFQANIVLDGVDETEDVGSPAWNNIKGSALFFRADGFFNVAQIFTKPYNLTFPDAAGIPLRLTSDPNVKSVRAGLQDTYQQILSDLHTAARYLPVVPMYKTRPSKPAAYAMLSRVYLVMQDYSHAFLYADSCLKLYDSLLDYNTLNASLAFPVTGLNKEVLFQAAMSNDLYANFPIVDTNLYKSYNVNDLRLKIFFKANTNGGMMFTGSYTGGSASSGRQNFFAGLATDEVYLTRAECYARAGKITEAMGDLNAVMIKRFRTGFFVPFTASNTTDALNLILQERRKETIFRGLRWLDLRRLNNDGANITLTRKIDNQTYTLEPNSPRYAMPIPTDIITLTGMDQNER
ncbi:MAG TPA: RagB/SusD family nutrient uptake outer membrane protein [Niastella sp.]|nr:RagB/SusD family nutrient uptake outer membrane protein [Niastella sp.]